MLLDVAITSYIMVGIIFFFLWGSGENRNNKIILFDIFLSVAWPLSVIGLLMHGIFDIRDDMGRD